MENFPGWTVAFELMYRQEQSRHASGRIRVKDFGTPIWTASYQSRQMRPNELDQWRARINALENGMQTFRAWPKSRCWPQANPNGLVDVPENWVLASSLWDDSGVWLTNAPWTLGSATGGTIAEIGSDNKSIRVQSNTATFTVGDYVEIHSRWLHQVTDVDGQWLDIVPHLSVGALVGQTVNVDRPGVDMVLVPGSVQSGTGLNGRGSISFMAVEARG